MEIGPPQRRNAQMRGVMDDAFLRNLDFYADGARLLSAVLATHRANDGIAPGGGQIMYGWMADSRQNHGAGCLTYWTETSIAAINYSATDYGGPRVLLDGATDYLSIADAAWQEAVQDSLMVWHWVNASTITGSDRVISGKYNTAANQSWRLYWNSVAGAFRFSASLGGAADTEVTSSFAETTGEWYFVAGVFFPSTLMRIYVGQATDLALETDELAVGVPAGLFNGNAALTIGASYAAGVAGSFWDGYIGIGGARLNVPSGAGPDYEAIDAYVTRLFRLTSYFYR